MTLLIFGAAGLECCVHLAKAPLYPEFLFISIGLILLFWKERPILDFLKSRLTYPRTGYVQPPKDRQEPLWGGTSTPIALSLRPGMPPDENVTHFQTRTMMVILLWCYFLTQNQWERGYTLLAMPVLAAALYVGNRKSERRFRWWSALLLALTGPLLLWIGVPLHLQPLLLPLLAGLWLVAEGGFRLAVYLRANPHPRASEGVPA
jgi:hypothetical protein